MPWFKKYNVIYVHIPKTGGFSIIKMFGIYKAWWLENYVDVDVAYYCEHMQHASAYIIRDTDPEVYKNCYKFTLVRNPYDRLVSLYFWKKMHSKKHFIDVFNLSFSKFIETLFEKFHTLESVSRLESSHFLPQTSFIEKDVAIFKFEEIEKCFYFMCEKYKLNAFKEKINETEHNWFETYYTKSLKELVYKMYIFDFALLKYNK